jgi:hypothetical protein
VIFQPGKKTFISPPTLIHLSRRFTSVSKPAAYKSFGLLLQLLPHLRFNLFVVSETFAIQLYIALRDKHYPTLTGNISLWISFALSPFANRWMQNRTLRFGSTVNHSRHFDYWNQPLNMLMCVCYVACHEAGLYSYLPIHKLLLPLQLFYSHLWPIYWLPRNSPMNVSCRITIHIRTAGSG